MTNFPIPKKLTNKQKLDLVNDQLFPKLEIRELTEGDQSVRVLVNTGVIANLLSCLQELKEGKNDEVVQASLQSVINRLEIVESGLMPDTLPSESIDGIKHMIVDFR